MPPGKCMEQRIGEILGILVHPCMYNKLLSDN